MKITDQYSLQSASGHEVDVLLFDQTDYQTCYSSMSEFTATRSEDVKDQIWIIEHPPVYTQGTACNQQTFIPSDIPVVKTDRGGQITYHGPGQLVMYPLLRLKRFNIGVKALVTSLEQSVIDTLGEYDVESNRRQDAPGVYVEQAKIAALGLRIRRGHSYHGLSFNVDMDLSPFSNVDPCGYKGLEVTQLKDCVSKKYDDQLDQKLVSKKVLENFLALI